MHMILPFVFMKLLQNIRIKRTSSIRGNEKSLIISYIKPHKAVVSTSISHWIKVVMKDSGVDVEKFGAHSARGAITSKAKQSGLPISEIMKSAGWSSSEILARFYDKPMEESSSSSFKTLRCDRQVLRVFSCSQF